MSYANKEQAREMARLRKQLSREDNGGTKFHAAKFIVWDGEGIEPENKQQVYGLLAFTTWDGRKGHIVNANGLSSRECFNFLCDVANAPENEGAIHCIFAGGYDTHMMFKANLSKEKVESIWKLRGLTTKSTWYDDFGINYIPRKELIIRRCLRDKNGKLVKNEKDRLVFNGSIHLWDVFTFFQCSFLKAIENWLGKGYTDYKKIKQGKEKRGAFYEHDLPMIIDYCYAELEALRQIMQRLQQALLESGLAVKRWDGAGAVAAAMLQKYHVKDYLQQQPDYIQQAAQYAFAGGRIECLKIGHQEQTIYQYDINSAYPSIIRTLPSMRHGEWKECTIDNAPDFSLVLVRWKHKRQQEFYPFFYREANGMIFFPADGFGWHWLPEVKAALKWFKGNIIIEKCYGYFMHEDVYPFTFIDDVYTLRQKYVKENNFAEKVLKLGMNAMYGKMAQKIGTRDKDGNVMKPTYHQLEYAGYITACIRAMMYDAAMQKPKDIIAFATDGISSFVPLDVPCPKQKILGQWELKQYKAVTIAQSGVYWLHDDKGKITAHYRGFDEDSVREKWVILKWKYIPLGKNPTITTRLTRFVTAGAALRSEEYWKKYATFASERRTLALSPDFGKRELSTKHTNSYAHCALVPTQASDILDADIMSRASRLAWYDFEESYDFEFAEYT